MSNIAAAIGLAQLEKARWHLSRRREIAEQYIRFLAGVPGISIQPEKPWARNVYWMTSAVLNEDFPVTRNDLMGLLAKAGIETRPFFCPMHTLPMYKASAAGLNFPVADPISRKGLNLPSSASLSEEEVEYVCKEIIQISERNRKAR